MSHWKDIADEREPTGISKEDLLAKLPSVSRESVEYRIDKIGGKPKPMPELFWMIHRGIGAKTIEKLRTLGLVKEEERTSLDPKTENWLCQRWDRDDWQEVDGKQKWEALRESVRKALIDEGMTPWGEGKRYGMGPARYAVLCQWIGIDPKQKPASPKQWKFDPYTGKPINRNRTEETEQ